jgi:hypothetical protein
MELAFAVFASNLLFCVVFTTIQARERDQWRKERMELIQRIQAPEQAVVEHGRSLVDQAQSVPPIALDDDQAYEKLRLRREGPVPD